MAINLSWMPRTSEIVYVNRTHQAGQSIRPSRMLALSNKQKGRTMIIRQTCVFITMMSGILLFAGCVFLGNEYEPQGVQFESAPEKALAGSYSDIGSNGSIKPHPESLYKLSQEQQEPQSQTTGEII